MTRDEILALKPGRELDALVAEKVIGWFWARFRPSHEPGVGFVRKPYPPSWKTPYKPATGDEPLAILWDYDIPHFSTDIAAAWGVVEKMREHELSFHAKGWIKSSDVEVRFTDWYAANGGNGLMVYAIGTAPEAICKAALLAVMEVGDE